jgi:AraC-like DNA-binding protein
MAPALIRTLACTYFGGHHIEPHVHPWGQLIYAATGVMRVKAAGRLWLVPPARAVWAPAGVEHEIWARGDFAMRTLYVAPHLARVLPGECLGLDVSPLLRELIVHIVGLQMLYEGDPDHEALAQVTVSLLRAPAILPTSVRWPADPRAVAAAERLLASPAEPLELAEVAKGAGAGVRTLQRLFLEETGFGFAEWRQRMRLLHAATLLSEGVSVTEAGLEAGYASTSAFIAAFKKQLGRTPARLRP